MTGRIMMLCIIILLLGCAKSQDSNTRKKNVMTRKENNFINPKDLFNPTNNGFSHIVSVPEGKEIYYFSGQWASNTNGELVSNEFEEQVKQTVANVKKALSAVGLSINDVVKQTVYIVDFTPAKKEMLIDVASKEWRVKDFPASTIVPLPVLATAPNCLIEIEIIAAK